jgi:hypothetical protein
MRADGSAGVAATITLGFSGERIGPASIAAVVGGLLLVLLTFAFVLYRRRKRRRSAREAASAAAAPRTSISEGQGDVVDLAEAGSGDPAGVVEGVAEATAARPGDDSVR